MVPHVVISSREVAMESLELTIRDSGWSPIVNALTYMFAQYLNEYACSKIASQLDKHTGTLVGAMNMLLDQAAPLLARIGWNIPAADRPLEVADVMSLEEEGDDVLSEWADDDIIWLDFADPGRTFAVRM